MKIIPVIDLKGGKVVSAHLGQRNHYKTIQSTLCNSYSIVDVIHGFLTLFNFDIIYIADIDAITNTGNNRALINQVLSENLSVEFWIDNGTILENITTFKNSNYRLVIGSECQKIEKLCIFKKSLKNYILSLDFFPDSGYSGPDVLFENPDIWPKDIIIMTLDRVGGNSGPDLKKLKSFAEKYTDKNLIAAGGVRCEADLLELELIGIGQVLVSSALHKGIINNHIINKFQTKKYPV